ncbi:MAG: TSUP family transporter [Actinobacteria bacterium]|nr:TSUP family transporter [Actinomycetota bacterium]
MFLEYLKFFSIGILGSIVSGLLGIGGGVLILPILLYITGIEIKIATAISTLNVFLQAHSEHFFAGGIKQ